MMKFDYDKKIIEVPMSTNMREVYAAQVADRMASDEARCWSPPINGELSTRDFSVYSVNKEWEIRYMRTLEEIQERFK